MGSQLCSTTSTDDRKGGGVFLSQPQNIRVSRSNQSGAFNTSQNGFISDSTSLILGCKQYQNLALLNKYLMTYTYYIENVSKDDIDQQINDFVTLLRRVDQDKQYEQQIKQFEKQYKEKDSPKAIQQYSLGLIFKNSLYWKAIQQFPTISQDPTILGYIRRPLRDLHNGIKRKYQMSPSKKVKYLYAVVQFNQKQQKILKDMINKQDYFAFSTFLRCFTSQDKAVARRKQLLKQSQQLRSSQKIQCNTIFFYISIPAQSKPRDKQYDYGFYVNQNQKNNPMGDAIINIMNFFKITDGKPDLKQYNIEYGSLSFLKYSFNKRDLKPIPEIIHVYNVIQAKSSQIKSQSHLLRVVQQTKDSISASQKLLKSVGKSNKNVEQKERINLIQTLLQDTKYNQALKQCASQKQAKYKVKQMQVYYQMKKYDKVDQLLKQLQPQSATLKNSQQGFQSYVLIQLVSAKRKVNQGQKKTAKSQLEGLLKNMESKYKANNQFRSRDILKALQECQNIPASKSNVLNWNEYADGLNIGSLVSY